MKLVVGIGTAMKTFDYIENEASQDLLRQLKHEFENANAEQKYYKYKAWLHYANLDRWRKQGHHFYYLTMRKNQTDWMICTCGLSVSTESAHTLLRIPTLTWEKVNHLQLDALQSLEGHRDFKEKSPVCALIIDYEWVGRYLWTAYCQTCGEFVTKLSDRKAKAFTKNHNKVHLGKLKKRFRALD